MARTPFKVVDPSISGSPSSIDPPVPSGTTSPPAAAAEARVVVRAFLREIGDDQMIGELLVFHDWTPEEVAALSGGTPLEVSQALGRVLARLGDRMEGMGA